MGYKGNSVFLIGLIYGCRFDLGLEEVVRIMGFPWTSTSLGHFSNLPTGDPIPDSLAIQGLP